MSSHISSTTCSAAILFVLILTLIGCRAAPEPAPHSPTPGRPPDARLSNGYSLLYDLVNKERNVDKLLWLKSAPDDLAKLVKSLAATSSEATRKITAFAERDPMLKLDRLDLPPMEQATRTAIESSTRKRLLLTGDHFATLLALKQVEAAEYGLHLAQLLSQADEDVSRRQWLEQFADAYRDTRDRLIDWLATGRALPD